MSWASETNHHQHAVTYARMDNLDPTLLIARGDAIAHHELLHALSGTDVLIIDYFLTDGIDHDAASDLFAILANREHRLQSMIAPQTGILVETPSAGPDPSSGGESPQMRSQPNLGSP